MAEKTKIPTTTVEEWVRDNPIRVLDDGRILTCPVRLAFVNIEKGQTMKDQAGNVVYDDTGAPRITYNVVALFPHAAGGVPPQSDGQIKDVLYPAWFNRVSAKFPDKVVNGVPYGLYCPFRDQGEKAKYDGFEAGCVFLTVGSQYRPVVVDSAGNEIPEGPAFGAKVYAGAWAILSLNAYDMGNPKKPGANFGLSSIMIISDDEKLTGGGGEDTKKTFQGVKVNRQFNAAAAFENQPATPSAPPPAPLMQSNGPTGSAPPPAPEWKHDGFTAAQLVAAGWTRSNLESVGAPASVLSQAA